MSVYAADGAPEPNITAVIGFFNLLEAFKALKEAGDISPLAVDSKKVKVEANLKLFGLNARVTSLLDSIILFNRFDQLYSVCWVVVGVQLATTMSIQIVVTLLSVNY